MMFAPYNKNNRPNYRFNAQLKGGKMTNKENIKKYLKKRRYEAKF